MTDGVGSWRASFLASAGSMTTCASIDPSLRRILAQARAFASMPCVLPLLHLQTRAVPRRPFG